jgi:hypothetical protein
VESEIRIRYGEDVEEMLLEKQVLCLGADTGVSIAFLAIGEHFLASLSSTMLSKRTMSLLATSSIWRALSFLLRCYTIKKNFIFMLSSSYFCRICSRHVLPFGLRSVGIA